jgi:hypothetical protein
MVYGLLTIFAFVCAFGDIPNNCLYISEAIAKRRIHRQRREGRRRSPPTTGLPE